MHRSPEELRTLVEGYLAELAFTPELGALEEALRYPLESGGKRVRPVIALAVGEAAGAAAEQVLPAAAAARPRTSRSARQPHCSRAMRSSQRRSGLRCPIRRRWSAGSSRRRPWA